MEFRLKAFRYWQTLEMPSWAHLNIPTIDYQDIIYYAAPKKKEGPKSLDEIDPELMKTFDKLGIPLHERAQLSGMAVDAVMESVSVKTTFKETLAEKGIIFCGKVCVVFIFGNSKKPLYSAFFTRNDLYTVFLSVFNLLPPNYISYENIFQDVF